MNLRIGHFQQQLEAQQNKELLLEKMCGLLLPTIMQITVFRFHSVVLHKHNQMLTGKNSFVEHFNIPRQYKIIFFIHHTEKQLLEVLRTPNHIFPMNSDPLYPQCEVTVPQHNVTPFDGCGGSRGGPKFVAVRINVNHPYCTSHVVEQFSLHRIDCETRNFLTMSE